jgi:hypothetical protein
MLSTATYDLRIRRSQVPVRSFLTVLLFLGLLWLTSNGVQAGGVTSTTVTVNWTSPGDDGSIGTATQYDLRYSTSTITDANWTSATRVTGMQAPKAAGTRDSFIVVGLTPNTTYFFAIKSSDDAGNVSTISNIVTHTTSQEQVAPAAVTGMYVNNVTASSIRLIWTAPGDDSLTGTATQYDIRYSTAAITAANWASATQATGEPTPHIAGTSETFTVTGLNPNTAYYFAVKTGDEVPNWSGLSNIATGTTSPETVAPAHIANLLGDTPTANSIRLTWTAPGDDSITGTATIYDVRYSLSPITEANWASATPATGEPAPHIAGTSESFVVTGLTAGTTYYFAIKTADEVPNWAAISNVVSAATIDNIAPAAINDLSVLTGSNPGDLILSWTATGDDGDLGRAASYLIGYSPDTVTATSWGRAALWSSPPAPAAPGQRQTIVLTGLAPAQHYWVAMRVVDDASNMSAVSNIAEGVSGFNFGAGTGDEFTQTPTEFQVAQNYPNPFNPSTAIKYAVPKASHVTIAVYNVIGQLTNVLVDADKSAGSYTAVWDGTDLNGRTVGTGIYMYRLQAGSFVESRKMVLMK